MLLILLSAALCFCRRRAKRVKEPAIEAIPAVECADQPKVETEGVAVFEKDGLPFAEMEGHIFPELHCPDQQPETRELDIRITRTDLSTIFELYESSVAHPEPVVVQDKAPPEWI